MPRVDCGYKDMCMNKDREWVKMHRVRHIYRPTVHISCTLAVYTVYTNCTKPLKPVMAELEVLLCRERGHCNIYSSGLPYNKIMWLYNGVNI